MMSRGLIPPAGANRIYVSAWGAVENPSRGGRLMVELVWMHDTDGSFGRYTREVATGSNWTKFTFSAAVPGATFRGRPDRMTIRFFRVGADGRNSGVAYVDNIMMSFDCRKDLPSPPTTRRALLRN